MKLIFLNNNFLKVYANNQQIYSNRLDSSYRRRVYLLAWGDESDCKIKFENIVFSI